jgi:hypothetical protein
MARRSSSRSLDNDQAPVERRAARALLAPLAADRDLARRRCPYSLSAVLPRRR